MGVLVRDNEEGKVNHTYTHIHAHTHKHTHTLLESMTAEATWLAFIRTQLACRDLYMIK